MTEPYGSLLAGVDVIDGACEQPAAVSAISASNAIFDLPVRPGAASWATADRVIRQSFLTANRVDLERPGDVSGGH
jgi:hypothetical protein